MTLGDEAPPPATVRFEASPAVKPPEAGVDSSPSGLAPEGSVISMRSVASDAPPPMPPPVVLSDEDRVQSSSPARRTVQIATPPVGPPRRGHRRTFTETYRAEQLANGLASLKYEQKSQLVKLASLNSVASSVGSPLKGRDSLVSSLSSGNDVAVETTNRRSSETRTPPDVPFSRSSSEEVISPRVDVDIELPSPNALEKAIAQEREALQISEELPRPRNLRRETLLGTGGFAVVWLARDRPTGRCFALKQMGKGHVVDCSAGERVLLEKQAHEDLSHPFIVKLFTTFQDRDNLYFVLELATGGDLFEVLQAKGGRFTEDWARFYAGAVALGLRHMHFTGYVYRDLKPENILLDSKGFAKLADLGFAKRSVTVRERSYTNLGTEMYASPEFVHGRGRTAAADWWSVGVLLHEMIVGEPPFTGENTQELMQRVSDYAKGKRASNDRLRKHLVDGGVSAPAADLVAGFLEEEEGQRLGSTAAGFRAIQHHVWFARLDWVALLRREHEPPFVPVAAQLKRPKMNDEVLRKKTFDREIWQPIFDQFGPTVSLQPTWYPQWCDQVGDVVRDCLQRLKTAKIGPQDGREPTYERRAF